MSKFTCSKNCTECGEGIPDSAYINGPLCLSCIESCTSCGEPNQPHERRSLCQPCGSIFMAHVHSTEITKEQYTDLDARKVKYQGTPGVMGA